MLHGQHKACIQVLSIQAVPSLVLDVGELAEQMLLHNRAWDLHQRNAGNCQLASLHHSLTLFFKLLCC